MVLGFVSINGHSATELVFSIEAFQTFINNGRLSHV